MDHRLVVVRVVWWVHMMAVRSVDMMDMQMVALSVGLRDYTTAA